jgi:hypothetical protein
MAQDYPTLNDIEPSWADLKASFPVYGGETVVTDDIAGIKCSDKLNIGVVRGTGGGRKRRRTTGELDSDASATFYPSGWRRFRDVLAAKDKRIGLVGFDLIFQLTPPRETRIYTIKIAGCRVAGRTFDFGEGPDAPKIEIPLDIMFIEEDDGISLL